MINQNLSVVTVTKNNAAGLLKTLTSLSKVRIKPASVIIMDGGSSDDTRHVVDLFATMLRLNHVQSSDRGIYDAMNNGRRLVKTELVHYLNAGDTVVGDIYSQIFSDCRLRVGIVDLEGKELWEDYPKLLGFGYCHQGIILPTSHPDYDVQFDLAADFDLISKLYPKGVLNVPLIDTGKVLYELGGVSSRRSLNGSVQILAIAKKNLAYGQFLWVSFLIISKHLVPRYFRRLFASFVFR